MVSTALLQCQKCSIVCLARIFCIRPSVDRHRGCVCFLVITSSAAGNTGARVCVRTDVFIALGHIPKCAIAGSHGHSTCNCFRNSQAAFHGGCSISRSFPAARHEGANSCAASGFSCYYSHPSSCCESTFLDSAVQWPSCF